MEQLVALGNLRTRGIRIDDRPVWREIGDVVEPERHAAAVVRLVAGQLERPELAGESEVLLVVDVRLAADTQHRVLAHQVLDQLDQLRVRAGAVDAAEFGREQGMQLVDFHGHATRALRNMISTLTKSARRCVQAVGGGSVWRTIGAKSLAIAVLDY